MLPQTQRLPLRLIVGAFGLCLSTVVVPDSVAQVSDVPVAGTGYVRPSPPGRLVDVDGRRLHVFCKVQAPDPSSFLKPGCRNTPPTPPMDAHRMPSHPLPRSAPMIGLGWGGVILHLTTGPKTAWWRTCISWSLPSSQARSF